MSDSRDSFWNQHPIVIILLLIVAVALVLSWYLVDETIEQGAGYGFEIGASKQIAYQSALSELKGDDDSVIVLLTPSQNDSEQRTVVSGLFEVSDEEIFHSEMDVWRIDINGSSLNTIQLTFSDGRLVRIDRRRRIFGI